MGDPRRVRRTLSYDQFFHVSPTENRESIAENGLDHSLGSAQWDETDAGGYEGNYLFTNPVDARNHARNMASASEEGVPNYLGNSDRFDLWEVNVPKVQQRRVQADPILQDSKKVDTPIPRGWLRRRESIGPWGEQY